jgi:hypothetical protein
LRHALTTIVTMAATAVAGVAAAGGLPAPVDLWNGAQAGMSVDAVYALFSGAQPATGQSLENGAIEALSAPATIDGRAANALFFFRDKVLDAVLVEQRDVQRGQRSQNLAEARELVTFATQRYGAPNRCADWRGVAALSCTWRDDGLAVAVSYHDFGGGSPSLSILYRAAG